MQLKIGENTDKKQEEVEAQQAEEGNWRREQEEKIRYFEANFKYGATTVLKHNGEFFFRGDISHCGTDNIFFNARKIKSMMEVNGHTMGHMNYNDPPTFSSNLDWDRQEKERKEVYKGDLYKFVGDEIAVAELIGAEPIGHIYNDSLTVSEGTPEQEIETSGQALPDCGSRGHLSPEISLFGKGNLPEVRK
jgi:hypothetical protein